MRLLFASLLALPLFAQTPDTDFFEKKIRPIFAANCYACHGAKTSMGGLSLASRAGFDKGTDAGPLVDRNDPSESRILKAIGYSGDVKMPPSGKLKEPDIAAIRTWVERGAPFPKDTAPVQISSGGRKITAADRDFWSFRPVANPVPPAVKNRSWVKNPIDQFILAKLEEKGIAPSPAAGKLNLLRRVTYDLIGLPPTPAEITQFLNDQSPDAYAKVVDRLLASPKYGERWGRHWLDVARYADSTGMDEDHIYPYAWRYRDYVVKAFNEDLPYNRFVMEQLAGDLLPVANEAERDRGVVATGFLALGPKPLAQQDRIQMIYDVVDEQIDTTSKAFLGITLACARCHDHKFDPLLTRDYYAMAGIFASTRDFRNLGRPGSVSYIYYAPLDRAAYDRYQAHRWRMYGKQLEMEETLSEDFARENGLVRSKVAALMAAAWKSHNGGKLEAGDVDTKQGEKWRKWLEAADDKAKAGYLKEWFGATDATIAQVAKQYQDDYESSAKKWEGQLENWRKSFAREVAQDRDLPARPKPDTEQHPFFAAATFNGGPSELPDSPHVAELRRDFEELQKTLPPEPPMASAVAEGPAVEQRVFLHGDHHNQGEPALKTFPAVLAGDSQQPVTKGSGRLELAQWIARPDNPLTARVMVNRIWQGHFGEALVRTPNNWGKTGDKPVEPELLDYLASRFIESGWSVKSMHRLILLSNTYRESVQASPQVREADPSNRLCAHFNRVRMSIEQLRDSVLALDGTLDQKLGGSMLAPPRPAGKTAGPKPPRPNAEDTLRRTLYIPVRRGSVPAVLSTFDFGDATSPGDGRPRTNVAPQALFLMNSGFVQTHAQGFAKLLLDDAALNDKQRIERAYLMALTRAPDAAEVDNALSYIANLEKRLAATDSHQPDTHQSAWQSFCHVLMSTNEFIYLN